MLDAWWAKNLKAWVSEWVSEWKRESDDMIKNGKKVAKMVLTWIKIRPS